MAPKLNVEDRHVSAEEVPQAERDPQRGELGKIEVRENRDCLSAGPIQSHSGQASAIQNWINNIQLYRFPLALAVVAVHSGEFIVTSAKTALSAGDTGLGLWLVDFVTLIARLATPSFLLIAGLIFCKDGKVSLDQFSRKVKSRCRTLLVPYLAWNFMAVLLLCAPSAFKYFFLPAESYTYSPLILSGLTKWMVGWPVYPADGPLWFVRDLLILIAMVPIVNFIPRRVQMIGLGALAIYWLVFPIDVIPGGAPRAFSVLFFMIGVMMGTNRGWLRAIERAKWLIYVAGATVICSAAAGAVCSVLGENYVGFKSVFEKVVRLSGASLIICAGARNEFPPWLSAQLSRLSHSAFFLFASHYLVFICVSPLFTKAAQGRFGQGHEVLLFFLMSSVVTAVSLACYFLLKRHAPALLGVLDGNRSATGATGDLMKRQVGIESLPEARRVTVDHTLTSKA